MYSPIRNASSDRKNTPEMMSRTRVCEPKPSAIPITPAPARIGVMFTLSEAKQTSVAMERSATKRKLRSTGATVCNRVAMAWWPSSPCAILIEGPSALWSRMLRTSCHSQYVLTIVEAVTTKPQPRCSPSWAFAVASGLTPPNARKDKNEHGEGDDTQYPPQDLLANGMRGRIGPLSGVRRARQSESRDEQGQQSKAGDPLPQRLGSGGYCPCAGDEQQRCSAEFQKGPAVKLEVAFNGIKRWGSIVRIIGSCRSI